MNLIENWGRNFLAIVFISAIGVIKAQVVYDYQNKVYASLRLVILKRPSPYILNERTSKLSVLYVPFFNKSSSED
jgi:hypothetical protein